ncbi:dihydrofolate reductase family protein [Blastococcus sp. TF02A-35]|uniref:dihydrofolate reductase family protein n=1 Tax=Blastococcus sp. TF02A-35 TaxID=2559612 RepID=UPI001FD73278|nr:dihydrofolate reductase family protein [Blastococcus sp. TF02A_35]
MLTYHTATTLDGFIADPDDSLDWLLRQQHDASGPFGFDEFMAGIGAVVMGSTTYEWVLAHEGDAWPYAMPTWVMTSRDLAPVEGADIRFASGDVRAVHEEMTAAAGGKDLWLVGGGDLAGQFAEAGLLDEVVVSVAPVTLGAGRPLLPRRLDLELVGSAVNGAFVCARYRVAGPLLEDRA